MLDTEFKSGKTFGSTVESPTYWFWIRDDVRLLASYANLQATSILPTTKMATRPPQYRDILVAPQHNFGFELDNLQYPESNSLAIRFSV